jgi:atypical dual specificity phosphatase
MGLEPKRITSRIYQGGWLRPEHIDELSRLGITHILNLDLPSTDGLPVTDFEITVHNIFIRDYSLMTPQLVREVMEVIDHCLSLPGSKIYIHCVAGVSRSPTITWLYLIHSGATPAEALEKITPNPALYDAGIVQQLVARRPPHP